MLATQLQFPHESHIPAAARRVQDPLDVLRSVPGRRYDADRKRNTIPTAQKRALWDGMRTRLPAGIVIASDPASTVNGVRMLSMGLNSSVLSRAKACDYGEKL
jgi:hypothetical protein